ncbi:HAMP domain-containing protein [Ectothiorhodospiraceae bacterium 2226]|nr:HAMP domain-containing protein [Ectothiorhodospiraceae bacterium 2226]
MSFFRSGSILRLVLLGYAAVAVPLMLGLIVAAAYVDQLARHSQVSVFHSANATQASRMLVEHVTALERTARQLHVLGDQGLLEVYESRRAQLHQTIDDLQGLRPAHREAIEGLRTREAEAYRQLSSGDAAQVRAAVEAFGQLNGAARAVLAESSQLIADSVAEMQRLADRTQSLLYWQIWGLIPAALLLGAFFATLIVRPLKRLSGAIRRLGDGDFSGPIAVQGPDDLRALGRHLEWMRQRVVALENQKVNFLRHMSHELKTPLTTIRESSQLLNEGVAGTLNDEQGEIVLVLQESSIRLQRLIEDLLDFSTLELDGPRLQSERVRLDRLVEEVCATHRLASRTHGLDIRCALVEVCAQADRDKLRCVLDNLLSNAVKYSPTGGRIDVSLQLADRGAVIDVRDQGPGIPPEERRGVFEAFFQGSARSNGPIKGTGLGLSIARECVQLHNGTLEVLDADQGAHFRVTLPNAWRDCSDAA